MVRTAIVIAMGMSLSACATKYQERGFTGGFSEVQLNADTYQINVSGNGYTSTERARNIGLLRASELTLRAGAQRFVILQGGVQQEYGGTTAVTVNRVGNTFIASGGEEIRRPRGALTIRILRSASDPLFAGAMDAKLIDAQLRPALTQ